MKEEKELHEQFFATPFWATEKPQWVEHLNKTCQPYLDESHEAQKEGIEKNKSKPVYRVTNYTPS